jgi:Na+-driven multidrug efflux pump
VLFLVFAHPIVSFFTKDEEIIKYGALSLRIFGSGYVFYGIAMVMTQALNGAGDTRTPTIINFVCFWLLQIPFAYFMAKVLDMKATGAFLATPVAETIVALLAWFYFKRGRWTKLKV